MIFFQITTHIYRVLGSTPPPAGIVEGRRTCWTALQTGKPYQWPHLINTDLYGGMGKQGYVEIKSLKVNNKKWDKTKLQG
jgi:hypothetical protein